MNVLEKILEELEERVNYRKRLVRYEKKNGTVTDVVRNQGALEELVVVEKIIRSHMDEVNDTNVPSNWISCSERLPEEDERYKGKKIIDVLITTAKGKVTKVQRQSHNEYWWWARIYGEPKAWKPLPEPYKGANYNG